MATESEKQAREPALAQQIARIVWREEANFEPEMILPLLQSYGSQCRSDAPARDLTESERLMYLRGLREGREQAAKLMCRGCSEGIPLEQHGPVLMHIDKASGGFMACYASAIRQSDTND